MKVLKKKDSLPAAKYFLQRNSVPFYKAELQMNYPAAEMTRYQIEIFFIIDAGIGVLCSFIPIRFAIGIIPFGHEIASLSSFDLLISVRSPSEI